MASITTNITDGITEITKTTSFLQQQNCSNDSSSPETNESNNSRPQPKNRDELDQWISEYCNGIKNHGEPITWNVALIKDMSNLFKNNRTFTASIDTWDTANVTSMKGMFSYSAFNAPINNFNTSNVTTMKDMFSGATADMFSYV